MNIYAWANPVKVAPFLDHTWVTTYRPIIDCPPDPQKGRFWYCWGDCHKTGLQNPKARLLNADRCRIKLASCLSNPNDPNDHAGITSWYGRYGVCHQVANRVLFSTVKIDKLPIIVEEARGFWLSHLLYGNYGGKDDNWGQTQKKCGIVNTLENFMDLSPLIETMRFNFGESFSGAWIDPLRDIQQEMLERKLKLEEAVEAGEMTAEQFAIEINKMLTEYLPRISEILGARNTFVIFGVEPGQEIVLVDPEIAKRSFDNE